MSQLCHPHIVQFLVVACISGSLIPVLLMEKLQTSLDNLLETSLNIPLDVKVHFLTGTARGVVYLLSHTPPIAHRDLTARNILIDSGLSAKIADLGVASMVNIQPGQLAVTMTAINCNLPPETVQEEVATRYHRHLLMIILCGLSVHIFPKDLKLTTLRGSTTRKFSILRLTVATGIILCANIVQANKFIFLSHTSHSSYIVWQSSSPE